VRTIAELSITAEVTRTELGLGNLDLNDDVNFKFGRGIEVGRLTVHRAVHLRAPALGRRAELPLAM